MSTTPTRGRAPSGGGARGIAHIGVIDALPPRDRGVRGGRADLTEGALIGPRKPRLDLLSAVNEMAT
jgi:hypothetical protein